MFKNNKDLRPQEPSKPKTVEVKVALPWTLIVLAVAVIASLITGWNLRSDDLNRVKAEAHAMMDASKVQSKE